MLPTPPLHRETAHLILIVIAFWIRATDAMATQKRRVAYGSDERRDRLLIDLGNYPFWGLCGFISATFFDAPCLSVCITRLGFACGQPHKPL